MNTLTFTWEGPYVPGNTQPYPQWPWVNIVAWTNQPQPTHLITEGWGIYIVEDNTLALPLYGGQSDNVRRRFKDRNDVLREYNMRVGAGMPASRRIWFTEVLCNPQNLDWINWAEHWLVRFLALVDAAQATQRLQNRKLLGSFPAPAGGLTVQWDQAHVPGPAYLVDNTKPGYMNAPPANGWVGYRYAQGSTVLP